jgi:hypothetical protein
MSKGYIQAFSFTVLLLLTLVTGSALAQISNPEGDFHRTDADMIWAQTLQGSHFNEFWNYQFYFDNGMKVHITFSAANFGSLKDPVTGVRVSVFNHDGELYQLSREYPLPHLVQDKENYRFQLREDRQVFFEGKLPESHRIVINTSKDNVDYDIDLNLHNIQQGVIWDDGLFTIGSEKVGIRTHIPYAEVRGHVTINNNRKQVTGTAYMDHTFQNQTTTRLMNSGYRFVSHRDSDNWDLIYFLLPDKSAGKSTIGYRISKTDGRIKLNGIENLNIQSTSRISGNSVARILQITLDDGAALRISRTEDDERFTVLGELGWVARRAARTFLGGEVIDFRGEAVLMIPSQRPKQGEYNFFIVD